MSGISAGIAATTALSLEERSLSELRSVPSISEQMALKLMIAKGIGRLRGWKLLKV
jgi:hypothetical protein